MTTPQASILEQIRLIVVPVSNPATAAQLLKLATALIDPEKGRVIALFIALENSEDKDLPLDDLQPIIDSFVKDGCPVELLTHPAGSVARGILDVAREVGADLLIFGVQNPRRGEFEIGPVARGVTAVAPCDVLIYATRRQPGFRQIVVPVDGSEHALTASRIALRVAAGFNTPVEAIHVQRSGRTQWEGRARIERSLAGLPNAESVRRTVVTATDPVSGLLARVREDDLIVIGFAHRDVFEKWLFSRFSERLLNNAPGPVILTSAHVEERTGLSRQLQRRIRWILPTLTELEQDTLVWMAAEMAMPSLDFFVLAIVAALIASAGLLLDSAAVIIGAMLVAPLMQPLIAFSVGLTTGRIDLMRRAIPTLLAGMLVALLIAYGFALLVGMESPTTEMLSRSHPTLIDAAVAMTAGLIGAYATARKDIPAALAGVAIAAALVPPLCTIGLALATGYDSLALGAFLLFVTNIVCISLAGWAVFFWMGMRPRLVEKSRRRQYLSWALVMLLALPILLVLLNLSNRKTAASTVGQRLQEAFAPAVLVDMQVEDASNLTILATLRSIAPITPEEVQIVQNSLSSQLNEPVTLHVVVQTLIIPPTDEPRPTSTPAITPSVTETPS